MIAQNRNEKHVVFMGNSIIQGWKQADPDFFSNPKFLNRGIGGQTTPQMLERFERDVLEVKPEAVLILAGTNDIAGNTGEITLIEIRDNIAEMAVMADQGGILVILCSVLPAKEYPWRPGREPNIRIPQLNDLIRELSEDNGYYYLDLFSAMADENNGLPSELAEDGVHPTRAGYDIMKMKTLEALKQLNLVP